jgi:predicted nucleic acid-binding protein
MTVVDASAVAAVLFGEAHGATMAAHLAGETLIAPQLIDYELAHVCEKKIRRQTHQQDELLALFTTLEQIVIERVPVPPDEVVALALATGLSTYDASYLWLATDRDIELVTLDRELARVNAEIRD